MPHAYTEDQLVEQPASGLFAEQVALPHPHPRPFSQREKGGRQAGLRVRSLVVLVSRLRAALVRLNPALPPEAIAAAAGFQNLRRTCDLLLPRLLSGQVSLSAAGAVVSLSPPKHKS